MADIFQEVDEEVRREQLKQLWDRYGTWLIAAAVVVVLAVAGWRGYQYYAGKKAAEAGAAFDSAVTLARDGKSAEAEAAFGKLANAGPSGYRMLARLREAAEVGQRDAKAGVVLYDGLAGDSALSQTWRDIAAVRAAMLLIDSAAYDEIKRRLEPLADPSRPFRHSARELLALSAWRAGNLAASKQWIAAISADPATPAGVRSRVEVIAALIAGQETPAGKS